MLRQLIHSERNETVGRVEPSRAVSGITTSCDLHSLGPRVVEVYVVICLFHLIS